MQQNKSKKNISEIAGYCGNSSKLVTTFNELLDVMNLNYINKILSSSKTKGIDAKNIFQIIFSLQFLDLKNIQQLCTSGYFLEVGFQKDVFYEFMKNPSIDWRRIVRLFCKQVIAIIQRESDNELKSTPKFLIVDDSLMPKTGKRIEFIGKVFDHCTHHYALGMKLLTLGYCDGKSFLPLDFSLHNEPGKVHKRGLKMKELNNQYSKTRALDTASNQRILEISKDKITTALSMIKVAFKKGIKANYILVDSWFVSEKFLREIQKIRKGAFVIGLMKTNRIISIKGIKNKSNKIPVLKSKRIKYSSKLKCHYIPLIIDYKGVELKAFWVSMDGRQSWKMLISTDLNISFIKAMEYYQVRWSIEVFFKDCKQNLNLNACQSIDFDSYISHVSIVFMNYMILSLRKRIDDYETIGILFRNVKNMIFEQTLIQKIWEIFIELFSEFLAGIGVSWDAFIRKMINNQEEINNLIKNTFRCLFPLREEF